MNPCKECIVNTMCKEACNDFKDYAMSTSFVFMYDGDGEKIINAIRKFPTTFYSSIWWRQIKKGKYEKSM